MSMHVFGSFRLDGLRINANGYEYDSLLFVEQARAVAGRCAHPAAQRCARSTAALAVILDGASVTREHCALRSATGNLGPGADRCSVHSPFNVARTHKHKHTHVMHVYQQENKLGWGMHNAQRSLRIVFMSTKKK